MTTVLIVDQNANTRLALEAHLRDSHQFERVLSCANLQIAQIFLVNNNIKVMLIDAQDSECFPLLRAIRGAYPELGVVLIQDAESPIDAATLQSLGCHAQTSRFASSIDIVANVAKALVVRLKPAK